MNITAYETSLIWQTLAGIVGSIAFIMWIDTIFKNSQKGGENNENTMR